MRSAMKAEWIKRQTSEMDGLWRCGVFEKVLCSFLTPKDRVFTSRFHDKIKRKGKEFGKYKVRLVVQGQHMRRKGADCVGDFDNSFSPVPAATGFHTVLSLATQRNISLITSMFLKLSFKENYCRETAIMARCTFLHF